MDGRVKPDRIANVLRETEAEIIALQEVLSIPDLGPEADQARYIADELGFHWALGENRRLRGGAYGNVVLSRHPLHSHCNFDITVHGRENRGCLRTDVNVNESLVMHVFNVHLGTAYLERRQQARKLVTEAIIQSRELVGPRVVLGDFNEWTPGLATRMLTEELRSADVKYHLNGRGRTYPGFLPFLHLDHVYHDPSMELRRLTLHRSKVALIASDHLPLIADFEIPS
jgi:endonuclease/exonuclease/phosphatase family metal-dependent hydrolase